MRSPVAPTPAARCARSCSTVTRGTTNAGTSPRHSRTRASKTPRSTHCSNPSNRGSRGRSPTSTVGRPGFGSLSAPWSRVGRENSRARPRQSRVRLWRDRRDRRRAALRRVRRVDRARGQADGDAARRDRARVARGDRRARAGRGRGGGCVHPSKSTQRTRAGAGARHGAGRDRARRPARRELSARAGQEGGDRIGSRSQGSDRAHGASADRAQELAARRRDRCARGRDHAWPHAEAERGEDRPSVDRISRAQARGWESVVIARLDGVLIERWPPHVVIDCGGVGYDVVCSGYTLAGLPADGERVTLRVFTHAMENKVSLFGFIDQQERALFDLLITVKNVGPSTAIAILSGSTPRDIAMLIAKEDVPGLVRIKGVGKKTAELLVVELHEKCSEVLLGWDAAGGL